MLFEKKASNGLQIVNDAKNPFVMQAVYNRFLAQIALENNKLT